MNTLVFAADEGVALGLAVSIHTVLRHLSVPVEIVVLDTGLSDASRRRLTRTQPDIRWIAVPAERLSGLPTARYLTVGAYARLLIPELLPEVRRAVYLDTDVVVKDDLATLFAVDLGGAPIAGVREFETPRIGDRPNFNSGVLILDCEQWREAGLAARVFEYIEIHRDQLRQLDQSALNAVIDDWLELDFRWNIQQALRWADKITRSELTDQLVSGRDGLYADAAILHFTSTPKPWYHSSNAPGTWLWVRNVISSHYYRPFEVARWLTTWLVRRGARGTLVALRLRPGLD